MAGPSVATGCLNAIPVEEGGAPASFSEGNDSSSCCRSNIVHLLKDNLERPRYDSLVYALKHSIRDDAFNPCDEIYFG